MRIFVNICCPIENLTSNPSTTSFLFQIISHISLKYMSVRKKKKKKTIARICHLSCETTRAREPVNENIPKQTEKIRWRTSFAFHCIPPPPVRNTSLVLRFVLSNFAKNFQRGRKNFQFSSGSGPGRTIRIQRGGWNFIRLDISFVACSTLAIRY